MLKTKNGKIMLSSKCDICGNRKSRFIKNQEAIRSLSSLGIKTPLCQISLLGNTLIENQDLLKIKKQADH